MRDGTRGLQTSAQVAQFAVAALEVSHATPVLQAQALLHADPAMGGVVWRVGGENGGLTRAGPDGIEEDALGA